MSTLGESLKRFQQLGYSFSNSSRSLTTLQYADDTCLVADGPSSCQTLLEHMERWLQWTGMKARVPKCHSLAIQATTGKAYDPKLVLQGASVPFIWGKPIKFLGAYIQVPPDPLRVRESLQSKLLTLLEKVDATPVTRNQKLLLYKAGICPRLLWGLAISDVPISWITKCLGATATRFLKKWSGLSRPADPSRLYLPKKHGGLGLPSISTLYRKMRSSVACQLLTSRVPITQQVTKMEAQKEESQRRAAFKPMLTARETMCDDPGAKRQTLLKCTKNIVETEDTEKRLDHAMSLATQGQLHHLVENDAATTWSEVVQKLPPECMKFALNAAQDTLPHNSNLALWRRDAGLSSLCKLCKSEKQTLLHVLNHCPKALELRRYNQRHDAILQLIVNSLQNHCPPDFHIMADLPGSPYTFPPMIASTDLRPDIVVWSDKQCTVVLAELTICYETNFVNAQQRKSAKYHDLLESCSANYSTTLITLEVGSRGFINISGFKVLLNHFLHKKRDTLGLLKEISREAITQSHKIWTVRNTSI